MQNPSPKNVRFVHNVNIVAEKMEMFSRSAECLLLVVLWVNAYGHCEIVKLFVLSHSFHVADAARWRTHSRIFSSPSPTQ